MFWVLLLLINLLTNKVKKLNWTSLQAMTLFAGFLVPGREMEFQCLKRRRSDMARAKMSVRNAVGASSEEMMSEEWLSDLGI